MPAGVQNLSRVFAMTGLLVSHAKIVGRWVSVQSFKESHSLVIYAHSLDVFSSHAVPFSPDILATRLTPFENSITYTTL
jgi:hypothetical protein